MAGVKAGQGIGRAGPVLVIKLSALGDFVQAFGPFQAIREAHPDREIHLLTTQAYAGLGEATGWFDRVVVDDRPKTTDLSGWLALRKTLIAPGYARVYDLQTSGRSSRYYKLFWPGPKPEWSGIVKGCSHPHANPKRDFMHTIERQAEQLAMAEIDQTPFPDLSGLRSDLEGIEVPGRFGLLVPGGAVHRRAKRWPWEAYAELCRRLLAGPGITPVLIGQEVQLLEKIALQAPGAMSLAGKTGLADIAELARRSEFAVGNDTGPMHVITLAGAHSVVLYSHDSDPALCAQRGPDVTIIRKPDLSDLPVDEVITAI